MVDITMVTQRFFRRRHPSQRLLGFRQWLLPQNCSAPTRRLLQSQNKKTFQLMIVRPDLMVNRTWKFTLSNQTICTNLRSFDRERRFSSCFARLLCVNRLRIERTTKFWLSKNRYQFKLLAHSQRGSFHGCFVTAQVYRAAEATTIVTFCLWATVVDEVTILIWVLPPPTALGDARLRQTRAGWRVRTVGVIQPLININACDVTLVP